MCEPNKRSRINKILFSCSTAFISVVLRAGAVQCAPQSGFIKTPQVLCTLNTVLLTSGVGFITFIIDNLHIMYCCLVNFLIFGTQSATTRLHVLKAALKNAICVTIYCHQELRFCDVGIKCTYDAFLMFTTNISLS